MPESSVAVLVRVMIWGHPPEVADPVTVTVTVVGDPPPQTSVAVTSGIGSPAQMGGLDWGLNVRVQLQVGGLADMVPENDVAYALVFKSDSATAGTNWNEKSLIAEPAAFKATKSGLLPP